MNSSRIHLRLLAKNFPGLALLHAALLQTASSGVAAPGTETALVDKTLVVWVAPANLTQRGGSALNLDDGRDRFDGVVFGELSPARWMAGSDHFRRTLREHGALAEESAGPRTFVQVAVVYAGKQVTVLRSGCSVAGVTRP